MATIDDEALIDSIIRNDGHYEDDPVVAQIVEYTNAWGRLAWGVTWVHEPPERQHRYEIPTDHVIDPRVIWRRS